MSPSPSRLETSERPSGAGAACKSGYRNGSACGVTDTREINPGTARERDCENAGSTMKHHAVR